jgi:hypothetical protein
MSRNNLRCRSPIPCYYGYGYKNVYELSDYLSVKDARLGFEGAQVK